MTHVSDAPSKERHLSHTAIEPKTGLGLFIRTERIKRSLSQRELAKCIGTNSATISHLETGVTKIVHPHILEAFAELYSCTIEDLKAKGFVEPSSPDNTVSALGRFIQKRCTELDISILEIARRSNISQRRMGIRSLYITASDVAPMAQALECEKEKLERFLRPHKPRSQIIPTSLFGKFLQDKRIELKLTFQDIADAIGVSREYIRQLEIGRHISTDRLVPLAEYLQVDKTVLLNLQAPHVRNVRKIHMPNTDKCTTPVGKWILEQRVAKNWSKMNLAARIKHGTADRITAFERGTTQPTRDTIEEIAKTLSVEIPDEVREYIEQNNPRVQPIRSKSQKTNDALFIPGTNAELVVRRLRELQNAGWVLCANKRGNQTQHIIIS